MEYYKGKFLIVGGLPTGVDENYLYEYDESFKFRTRHVLGGGYTLMGIQTLRMLTARGGSVVTVSRRCFCVRTRSSNSPANGNSMLP